MKHILKLIRVTPGVMLLTVFVSAPVFAEGGVSGGGTGSHTGEATTSVSTTTHSGTEDKSTQTTTTTPTKTTEVEHNGSVSTNAETEHMSELAAESTTGDTSHGHDAARVAGEHKVAELKKEHKEHNVADRQNFCNLHKTNLEGRFKGLNTSAQAIQTNITAVYTKAQAYKASANLTVPDYDALMTAVDAANATATADLAAMTVPTLDCTSTTVATDVATFKVSAEKVRSDLKAYRDAVKTLVTAIKAAAVTDTKTPTTTEGAN